MNRYSWLPVILASFLSLVTACVPPTPPPSPTPWPSDTPTPAETNTPLAQATAPPTATSPPTSTPTPSTVTITVWENLPELQAALLAEDVLAFQEAFPQFQIELQHYDTAEDFAASLTVDEVTFDIVLAAAPLLSNLQSTEQIAPANDFFPPSFLDAFAAATLAGASLDEQLWGLPDTTGFHLMLFYNRALVDTPPTNMADVVDLAETLDDNSLATLGFNSYDPIWLLPWLDAAGGWLIDETGQPDLDPVAAETALELYLSWHDPDDGPAKVQTYEEMRQTFLNGNMALMIDGEWAIRELSYLSDLEWGLRSLPLVDLPEADSQPAVPLILGRYWAISSNISGDQVLAATAFLEFVTEPERQLVWTSQFNLLPTRREALDDPQIVNDPLLRVNAEQMLAGQSVPLGVNVNALLDAMRDPLQAALEGELTAQEAAESMQLNLEALEN